MLELVEKIKSNSGPFLYEKGLEILSYQELSSSLKKVDRKENYKFLICPTPITVDFIKEYLTLIYNQITPILITSKQEHYKELYTHAEISNELERDPNTATIIFTSGSSSTPKAVKLSANNIKSSANSTNNFYQLDQDDNWGLSLPLNHIGGLMILWRAIYRNAPTTILNPAKLTEDLIDNPQVGIISSVGLQLSRLSKELDRNDLRVVLGGSKTSSQILSNAIEKGFILSNSYGSTETCAQILSTPFTNCLSTLETCGQEMNCDITLEEDRTIFESDSVAIGYIGKEDFDRKFIANDIFDREHKNYIIKSRNDLVFQKAGENINPLELESKLDSQSTVFALDNTDYENLIGLGVESELYSPSVVVDVFNQADSFKHPHHINFSLAYSTGIKTNRTKLRSDINELFYNLRTRFITIGHPSRNTLFVSHGFMGDCSDFEKIITKLSHSFFIILVDLPGHGINKKLLKETSKEVFIKDVTTLIKRLSKKPDMQIDFLTYSMGARVFHQIITSSELRNLTCIRNFINESGSPGFIGTKQERERRLEHDSKMQCQSTRKFFEHWYNQSVFLGISSSNVYENLVNRKLSRSESYCEFWTESMREFSVAKQDDMSDLSKVPKGTNYHYISGKLDEKYNSIGRLFKSTNYTHHIIDNSSHNTHLMNPKAYEIVINKILS